MKLEAMTTLSLDAKVWVFGLFRQLSEAEMKLVKEQLAVFTKEWKSHQEVCPGYFELRHQQFIVLANEHSLSGCSIDSAFACVREIEASLRLPSMKGAKLFYRDKGGVAFCDRYQASSLIKEGVITKETTIFNPTVGSWQEYREDWEILAKDSWLFSV